MSYASYLFVITSLFLSIASSHAQALHFNGSWARNQANCRNVDEEHIKISPQQISGYEWSCKIRSMKLIGDVSAVLSGDCLSTEGKYKDEIRLSMNGSKMVMESKNGVSGLFMRCH